MYANQLETYRTVQKNTMSGREIEASVLTKAAIKLQKCQECWGQEGFNSLLDDALRFNQLVWSVFQAELAKPDNPLPTQIRESILRLSLFVDKRIFEVMSFPSPEKMKILIDINLNIAAGLRGSPS